MTQIVAKIGGARLPLAPAALFPDRALDVIGGYLAAFLQSYLGKAWDAVGQGEPIVRQFFTHDPENYDFSVDHLPALYLFRQESDDDTVDITEDWQNYSDRIQVFWVFPPLDQFQLAEISRAAPLIGKTIARALKRGRDPSFVIDGDPDTTAAYEGSVIIRHAGLTKLRGTRWKFGAIAIKQMEDTDPHARRPFPCMQSSIHIEEIGVDLYGADPNDPNSGDYAGNTLTGPPQLVLTTTTGDGVVTGEADLLLGYSMLYVNDGNVSQTVNIAPSKLLCWTSSGVEDGLAADLTQDAIRVVNPGKYLVSGAFAATGTAGRVVKLRVRVNGILIAGPGGRAVLGVNPTAIPFAPGTLVLNSADLVSVYAEADTDGTAFTVIDASLVLERLS